MRLLKQLLNRRPNALAVVVGLLLLAWMAWEMQSLVFDQTLDSAFVAARQTEVNQAKLDSFNQALAAPKSFSKIPAVSANIFPAASSPSS